MSHKDFTTFPILKTERLILRQLKSTDAGEVFELRSDVKVNKYLDRKPAKSIDDAINFIRIINENSQNNESFYWAIALNSTGKLIGTICLFDFSGDNSKAEIGYELLPGFQGQGIMYEAISLVINYAIHHIGLDTIAAFTHSENQRSTRLLKKFNFVSDSKVDGNFIIFKLTLSDLRN